MAASSAGKASIQRWQGATEANNTPRSAARRATAASQAARFRTSPTTIPARPRQSSAVTEPTFGGEAAPPWPSDPSEAPSRAAALPWLRARPLPLPLPPTPAPASSRRRSSPGTQTRQCPQQGSPPAASPATTGPHSGQSPRKPAPACSPASRRMPAASMRRATA